MEPFIDGGLIEFLAMLLLGYAVNFIFFRKYLLLLYSVIALAAPMLLLLFRNDELFYWLIALCLLNAILLVTLLWKQRHTNPEQPLITIPSFSQLPLTRFFKRRVVQKPH